jgi:hypothetical protein
MDSFFIAIPLVGVLFGGALLAIVVFLHVVRARQGPSPARLEGELTGLIDRLAAEFPEEVRAWGGPGVLREPAIVDAIVERLNREQLLPSTGSESPASLTDDGERLRRSLLDSLVRRIADDHAAIARLAGKSLLRVVVLALAAGALSGYLVGEALYTATYPQYGFLNAFRPVPFELNIVLYGVMAGLAVWASTVVGVKYVRERRLKLARQDLADGLRELATDFPTEVRAWGGPAVLRDAGTVLSIARRLSGSASTQAGEKDLRQVLLISLVQRLADIHERIGRLERWSIWPAVGWGLLVGSFLGWLIGECLYAVNSSARATFPNVFRPEARFEVLSAAVVYGAVVWTAVVAVAAGVRARRLGTAQGRLAVCIRELATAFPDEVRAWGGEPSLRNPDAVRELAQRSVGMSRVTVS